MNRINQKIHDIEISLQKSIDKYLSPKSQKIIKIGCVIFLIFAFFPEIYLVPYYFIEVKPAAEIELNNIVNDVQLMNSTGKKVDAISQWEEQNFTNIYGIKPNLSLDFGVFLLSGDGRYPVYINNSNNQPVKIRAFISPFTNDPFWITYYHRGACGELASLFDFVTNQSHIESRIVMSKGEDHAWNEVKINDTWFYFDPTLVEIYQKNPEYRDRWFSEPKNFEEAWTWNLSTVTIVSTNEDITSRYSSVVNISLQTSSTKQISVYKFDTSKNKWFYLFSRDLPDLTNITTEFQLGDSNKYKIEAKNFEMYLPYQKVQDKEIFLNRSENVSLLLNPENGKYDVNYLFLIFIGMCLILALEIRWIISGIKRRKKENL